MVLKARKVEAGCKKAGCKWCEKGECWSAGQVEKPSKNIIPAGVKQAGVKQALVKKTQLKKSQAQPGNQQQMMQMVQSMFGKQGMNQLMQMMGGASGAASMQPGGPQGLGDQSKMLLSQFVSQKTGQQATKETIVYTTTQVEDVNPPQFISEVTLVTVDPDTSHKGKAQASKKASEASAAAVALRKNGQKNGKGQPMKAAKKAKAAKKKDGACKESCKWCAKGECWTSGQVEKPAEA